MPPAHPLSHTIAALYEGQSRRIFATLVRLIGDFDLAEEAMHDAFAAAVETWARDGVPANPRAWIVSTARFKAIDTLRRRKRFDASLPELAERRPDTFDPAHAPTELDEAQFNDDQLRLIFTCCHPAISQPAQVALTLREVCGLTTEQVANAFLTSPATIAQRIVRGKAKIRDANIPYVVPSVKDIANRLEAVLAVIYLVFNEGYSASSGQTLTRPDLSTEAIRLGHLLRQLLPEPEVLGLLALMLLHESRRPARATTAGDVVLLEDQDRAMWNREQIAQGKQWLEQALATRRFGPYTLQAAISAVHADAATAADTDWPQIVALYDLLMQAVPTPVVELNRAVAVAMRDGPAAGLQLIAGIFDRGDLADYHLAHAAQADLHRRLGQTDQARTAYQRALQLTSAEPQKRFIERRLAELG